MPNDFRNVFPEAVTNSASYTHSRLAVLAVDCNHNSRRIVICLVHMEQQDPCLFEDLEGRENSIKDETARSLLAYAKLPVLYRVWACIILGGTLSSA